jgi:hypothetical protein
MPDEEYLKTTEAAEQPGNTRRRVCKNGGLT